MNARVWLAGLLMALLPSIVMAQGRIAVVNLEQAILQTDVAQQRLQEFESNEDFASDKSQSPRYSQTPAVVAAQRQFEG